MFEEMTNALALSEKKIPLEAIHKQRRPIFLIL